MRKIKELASRVRIINPIYSGEPISPVALTEIPGPSSISHLIAHHLVAQQPSELPLASIKLISNFKKSRGMYFQDIDGNIILDFFSHESCLPIGYNHADFLARMVLHNKNILSLSEVP